MNKQHILFIFSLIRVILASVVPRYSQLNQTIIRGTVLSIDGTPIESVSILLTGRNTSI